MLRGITGNYQCCILAPLYCHLTRKSANASFYGSSEPFTRGCCGADLYTAESGLFMSEDILLRYSRGGPLIQRRASVDSLNILRLNNRLLRVLSFRSAFFSQGFSYIIIAKRGIALWAFPLKRPGNWMRVVSRGD